MPKTISDFLKENFIEDLTYFEKKNKMTIDIVTDNSLIIPEHVINIQNKSRKTIEVVEHFVKLKNLDQQNKNHELINNYDAKKFIKKPVKKNFYKKAI